MPALIFLALLQSALLTLGQVTLKISLAQFPAFSWSLGYFGAVFGNLWFAAGGLCFGAASLLWMYIVKHFAFHLAFPMVSLSYVMGMLAAVFIFHEEVPFTRWIGLAFILVGVALISK